MPRQAITESDLPRNSRPYSPAVRAGDFIFVSGQASVDDEGNYVESTFAGELDRVMDNLRRILQAADATMEDIVQVRAFLGDMSYMKEFNSLYPEYFERPLPARTTVSGGISNLKIEIDVVAYAPLAR